VRFPCLSVGPLDPKEEGPTPVKLFCALVPDGKTGQRYLASIRGLDWRTCPVISQGLYLFWHFDMRRGRAPYVVPNMKIAKDWGDMFLISSNAQNKTQYSPSGLGTAMGRILKMLELEDMTKRKAHLFRAWGAQRFELGGVAEDEVLASMLLLTESAQTDKTGCWNQKIKNQVYKNNVSKPAIRFAAGLRVSTAHCPAHCPHSLLTALLTALTALLTAHCSLPCSLLTALLTAHCPAHCPTRIGATHYYLAG
jgi:hypothetical protein